MADILEIKDGVLHRCNDKTATNVTIPDGIATIGEKAFFYCYSLELVSIPQSVKEIGKQAFWFCESLLFMQFGGTVAQWKAVKKGAD